MSQNERTVQYEMLPSGMAEIRLRLIPQHAIALERALSEIHLWRSSGNKSLGVHDTPRMDAPVILMAVEDFLSKRKPIRAVGGPTP